MRIGMLELLAVLLVIGFTCISIARPTVFWESVYVSTTLVGILAAILTAIATRGPQQVFWIGFSVSAVAYWGAMQRLPEHALEPGEYVSPPNQLLVWAHGALYPDYNPPYDSGAFGGGMFSIPSRSTDSSSSKSVAVESFRKTQDTRNSSTGLPDSDANAPEKMEDPFALGNPFGDLEDTGELADDFGTTRDVDDDEEKPLSDRSKYKWGDRRRFYLIGHCAWTLLFGWIGGHFALAVYKRSS
ncbi:MAG: hypothetical protein JNL67_17050 [Planctomycetaceae bacterium]|nr:hypothetical protein [Planctomycetaceae bacterium]